MSQVRVFGCQPRCRGEERPFSSPDPQSPPMTRLGHAYFSRASSWAATSRAISAAVASFAARATALAPSTSPGGASLAAAAASLAAAFA